MELKPCPFCGGEAIIRFSFGNGYVDALHKKNCIIRPNTWLQSDSSINKQIKAWNRRNNEKPSDGFCDDGERKEKKMRMIDADALKDTIHIHHYPLRGAINSIDNGMWTIGIDQAIDEQATIDAEPVRYGYWIAVSTTKRDRIFKCSFCGNVLDFDGVNAGRGDANYCPNCGTHCRM